MHTILSIASAITLSVFVSAYPLYPIYPGLVGGVQSSYHNSGAYNNGAVTSVSPFGSRYNTWNNGYSSSQGSFATPYGNFERSSFNEWNNNAWSNNNRGYPSRYYW